MATKHRLVGKRVELHPATDWWMRGARFGEVVAVARTGRVSVKLDATGRTVRLAADRVTEVE